VLLEREAELTAISDLANTGGLLVVEGGAGTGKSSLLEAGAALGVERGRRVLLGCGTELESGFPFGVVRQLFERVAGENRSELPPPVAAVLGGVATGGPDGPALFAVLHGVHRLVLELSRLSPLLVVVDDAHWSDEGSQRWLAYLATRLPGSALALLVALRPAEAAARDLPLLAVRASARAGLRPALLSSGAVERLVSAEVGGPAGAAIAATVHRVTGGNPLYVTELLRALRDRAANMSSSGDAPAGAEAPASGDAPVGGVLGGAELPFVVHEDVAAQVLARVRRLAPDALAFAQALAVLGDGCDIGHAADVAGIEAGRAAHLAGDLVRLDVLAGDEPVRFRHPVVRQAVEASLGAAGRDDVHRAASQVLRRAGAAAGRVAPHLMRLRPTGDPEVVAGLRGAGEEALATGSPPAAVVLLERALAEPPAAGQRIAVLRLLARAEQHAGHATACDHLEAAIAETEDVAERAGLALQLARAHAGLFQWNEAVTVLERAREELGEGRPELAAQLDGELVASGLQDARTARRVLPVLDRLAAATACPVSTDAPAGAGVLASPAAAGSAAASVPRTGAAGPGAEALAVARGLAAAHTGQPASEAAEPLLGALELGEVEPANWQARAALLWALLVCDRYDEVRVALRPMSERAATTGSARALVTTSTTLGLLALRLGALDEARAAARTALDVIRAGDFGQGLPFAAAILADAALEAGDVGEAEEMVGLMRDAAGALATGAGVASVLVPAVRGRLRLAQGRERDALAEFERCGAQWCSDVWGMEMRDVGYLHWRAGAASALTRLGEPAAARRFAEAELADTRVFGAPRALGISLRACALGGEADRIQLLHESVDVLAGSPALLERARSLVELGAALRRAGARAGAREPLREGLELAAHCGARPLAGRAREELALTGARVRRDRRTGLDALTAAELRVARMAAGGRSNPEIARELYVALKTVEGHLGRVYAKLGVAGRGELSDVLG
jgi:DNA-binding CsgD family transcriptional regulator